jgi:hypothetical protein
MKPCLTAADNPTFGTSPLQIATVNFFMTFIATFAPAALLPIIRENLSLTKNDAGTAG